MDVPKVSGVTPVGSQVFIEILNKDEVLGTKLTLPNNQEVTDTPQAYILALGPGITPEDWGFNVGDRVMFSGGFVASPAFDDSRRVKGTIEPHSIKAVLKE